MTKNLNEIKLRIIKFAKFKGFSVRNFCKKNDISPSNFSANAMYSSISSDVLAKILTNFSDLNAYWLLLGQGEMIRKELGQGVDLELRMAKMEREMAEIRELFQYPIKSAKMPF